MFDRLYLMVKKVSHEACLSVFSGLFFVSAAIAQGVSNHEAAAFPVLHRHYYSINYPASWLVDSSGFMGGDVFIKSPKQDSLDRFSENVNVFV